MTEQDILKIIHNDDWMMEVLRSVKSLELNDHWVGGGFVRSKVWDKLHGYTKRTPLPDVDVVYMDPYDYLEEEKNESTEKEIYYENRLKRMMKDVSWSVTNQSRMHLFHDRKPYKSIKESMKDWVETATGVGVKLNDQNQLEFISAWGIKDLVGLTLKPSDKRPNRLEEFHSRIKRKQWLKKWPKLKIEI